MITRECLRKNGIVSYYDGKFRRGKMDEEEKRKKARYKSPNELLEERAKDRVRQSGIMFGGKNGKR